MNAIMKMSEKQIGRIVNDNKLLFVLKSYPSGFDARRDVLLIENEDTSQIFGTLKVKKVYWRRGFFKFLWQWSEYIAFISGSVIDYVFDKKGFFIFECYSWQEFK